MKKISLITIIALFLSSTISHAEPTLWKIQSNKASIYLFGSVHVGKPEMYPFSKKIQLAFENSQNLVLEIDLLNPEIIKAVAWMYLNARLPEQQTIENLLSMRSFTQLKSILKKLKLPYSSVEKIKPWLIAMNLELLMMVNKNYKPELGVDIHFATQALATRKNVLELESASEQFSYFDNLTIEQQVSFLEGVLEQAEDSSNITEQMLKFWSDGDQKSFETLVINEMLEDPKQQFFYDIFLKQRNIKMADKIAQFIETGESYFVVVGAAHYLGEDSIIKYLEKKGIEVKVAN